MLGKKGKIAIGVGIVVVVVLAVGLGLGITFGNRPQVKDIK